MAALVESGATDGPMPTLRQARDVPETLRKRAVAGKEKRRALNKARRNVFKKAGFSPEKACMVLKEGRLHGRPITKNQRGALGARCGEREKD